MDGASPGPGPAPSRRRRSLSKAQKIGLGLLFTLVGLFLLWGTFPTSPGGDARFLPVAAAGIAALWVGGILMGVGSRS
jgi:hypothetical protein